MFRISEQNILYTLPWCITILALVLAGCYGPGIQEDQIINEPHQGMGAHPSILYLDVSFDGSAYRLINARIIDSAFTPVPIAKIYGIYGVEVLTAHNEVSFEQYTWMKPINTTIRLPFSDSTAIIELIHRTANRKSVIGRFSREDILSQTN